LARRMSERSWAVHPLDYRYGDERVKEVFSQRERFRLMLLFEGKVAEVQSELGIIPPWAGPEISKAASAGIPLEKIREREERTKHEVAAVVSCLEETSGRAGRFVHFGLTSNDAIDTVMFLQVAKAGKRILEMVKELARRLAKRAQENRDLICVARTHGIHAEPYTYGLRFAVWLTEIVRCHRTLDSALDRAKVGKVSGAVGTFAAMGERGPEVERKVLAQFGLKPVTLATQVVPRDLLTSVILQMANLSSVLDRMATTLRNLHRTEIGEVSERTTAGQVGSSAMPHKRNPIGCEKVSGLSRVVRSLAIAALENNVLWDERDLTNSSTERAMVPEVLGLVSEQLATMIEVIGGLELDEEVIRRNLRTTGGAIFSEFVLTELILSGMGRGEAHGLLSELSDEARRSGTDFYTALSKNPTVTSKVSQSKLSALLDPEAILATSDELVNRAVSEAKEALGE